MTRLAGLLRQFRADQNGNIAVIFAIVLLPVLTLMAMGMDYSNLVRQRAATQTVVDSTMMRYANVEKPEVNNPRDDHRKRTENYWRSLLAMVSPDGQGGTGTGANFEWVETATQTKATMWQLGRTPSFFPGLIGEERPGYRVDSEVIVDKPAYHDIYVVMDNSSSMLIAEDKDSRDRLRAEIRRLHPGENCEFACHSNNRADNFYQIAIDNNIKLRIDKSKEAIGTLADKVRDYNSKNSNHIRLSLLKTASPLIDENETMVFEPSSVESAFKNKVADVQSPMVQFSSAITNPLEGYTDFFKPLTKVNSYVDSRPGTKPGSGTQSNPFKWIIMVSDGVNSAKTGTSWARAVSAFRDCALTSNFKVITITVRYLAPERGDITQAAADAASETFSTCGNQAQIKAEDSAGLQAAIDTAFNVITKKVRFAPATAIPGSANTLTTPPPANTVTPPGSAITLKIPDISNISINPPSSYGFK